MFFPLFLGFVILQRLAELVIAKRNAREMFLKGAVEYDSWQYKYIVIMHTCFFISLVLEKIFLNRGLNQYWWIFFSLFLAAQILRYWAIASLGTFWNTRIIILPGSSLVKKGPYRFLKHPNYAAVITELAAIPLIFSCYITAAVFTILNFFALKHRIKIEELALRTLDKNSEDRKYEH
jgi:methyltransferase